MIIKFTGDVIRENRLSPDVTSAGKELQPWQFKEFYDAATLGVEFIWPFKDFDVSNNKNNVKDIKVEKLSDDFFAITFDSFITTQRGYSLFIFPHHTVYLDIAKENKMPLVIPQVIESDWWTRSLRILFVNKQNSVFRRNKPFAQGSLIPQRDYTFKKMSEEDIKRITESNEYLKEHEKDYVTREITKEGYANQNNLYQRLSSLNKRDKLPMNQKMKTTLKPKVIWR